MADHPACGVLELHPKGFGFLRNPEKSFVPQPGDAYVPAPMIQRHQLREGLLLSGSTEPPRKGNGPRLTAIDSIEDQDPDHLNQRKFDDLTPIDPNEQVKLEIEDGPLTTRVMDMFTPIGKGQRGLIVAPPRSGKTVLIQHIAEAVVKNHPEMYLFVLLIDERPEEVTEWQRLFKGNEDRVNVFASSSDRDSQSHVRTAEIALERAKRLAEQGKEVFVILDSLTRLARAYNRNVRDSGRTISGGIDVRALEVPKRLFGSARAFEEGGSLTVMGTALIDTGSRMDDVIFEEFKGTGNMELVLDRNLADRRIYPSIDIQQSGTRKEERILNEEDLHRISMIRRALVDRKLIDAVETLLKKLSACPDNAAFLDLLKAD